MRVGFAMRRLILLGLLAAMALPAGAARHVTVAQLEKMLARRRCEASGGYRVGAPAWRYRAHAAATINVARGPTSAPICIWDRSNPWPCNWWPISRLSRPSGGANCRRTPSPTTPRARAFWMPTRSYVTKTLPHLPDFFAPAPRTASTTAAGIQKG